MKPKSLLALLVVVAAVVFLYVYAWPQYQSMYRGGKNSLPPKVTINMPNPGGGT